MTKRINRLKNNFHDKRNFELNYVLDKINLKKSAKILDFGAGDGYLVKKMKEKGFHNVYGIDILNSNYKPELNISSYSGNIDDFPVNESYDVVFSSNVIEHIQNQEDYFLLFDKILKKNGLQIHIMPTHYWKFWNSLFYYYSVGIYILKKLFFKNNKKLKNNYKKTINNKLKQSPFFIGRHGSIGSTFEEFSLFNPINYFKILDKLNLEYESFKIPLIYSGHYFLGSYLSLKLRNKLSNILGYSCHCYVIKKND
tara:strand:+ start:1424 stop:2185 length:762 start_codon:yes stop_codon:yes gene_type:complete